jgi:hypothetical protein
MLMARIDASVQWRHFLVVRLLRRWSAEGAAGGAQLPSLVGLAVELGERPETAIAVASLFQLTESCLGRPLRAECCCSAELSSDEQAVLLLLDAAPSLRPGEGRRFIPHGLSGALLWAVASVRRLLPAADCASPAAPSRCPFSAVPSGPA